MRSSEVEPSSWKQRVRRIRDKGSIENQLLGSVSSTPNARSPSSVVEDIGSALSARSLTLSLVKYPAGP